MNKHEQEQRHFHLEGIKEEGATVPQPNSYSHFIEVAQTMEPQHGLVNRHH
jgi:hypothetical protein